MVVRRRIGYSRTISGEDARVLEPAVNGASTDISSRAGAGAPLLDVQDLHVRFETSRGTVRAVDGISYSVAPRRGGGHRRRIRLRQVGLVARDHAPAGQAHRARPDGRIRFEGRDLLALSDDEMREVRGRDIAMIFQEPMTSLNPVLPIGAADHGAAVHPSRDDRGRCTRRGDRAAAAGRHHRRRAPARAVPASVSPAACASA